MITPTPVILYELGAYRSTVDDPRYQGELHWPLSHACLYLLGALWFGFLIVKILQERRKATK